MAKKQVTISLRRPKQADAETPLAVGTPDAPTVVDAFVDSAVVAPVRASFGATPSVLPGRVQVTLQLPNELANRLLVRCLDDDRDASNVVAALVRDWLDGKSNEPEIGWRDVVRWARRTLTPSMLARWSH